MIFSLTLFHEVQKAAEFEENFGPKLFFFHLADEQTDVDEQSYLLTPLSTTEEQ